MARTLHQTSIAPELTTHPSINHNSPLIWFGGYVLGYSFDMGFNGGNPSHLQINLVQDSSHIISGTIAVGSILGFPISPDYMWHGIVQTKEYEYDTTEQKNNMVVVMESVRSALQNICCIVGPDAQAADVSHDSIMNVYSYANIVYGLLNTQWDIWKVGIGMPLYVFINSLEGITFNLYGKEMHIEFDLDDDLETLYADQDSGLFVNKNVASLASIFDEVFTSLGRIWIEETEVLAGDDLNPTVINIKIKTINRNTSRTLTEDDYKTIMNYDHMVYDEGKYNNIEKISFGEELRREPIQHRVVGGNIETFYSYNIEQSLANGNMIPFFGYLPPSFGKGIRINVVTEDNRTLTEKYVATRPYIVKLEGTGAIYFEHAIIGSEMLSAFSDFLGLARKSAEDFYMLLAMFLVPLKTGNNWSFRYTEISGHPLNKGDNQKLLGKELEELWRYINEYACLSDYFSTTVPYVRNAQETSLVDFPYLLKAMWIQNSVKDYEASLNDEVKLIFESMMKQWPMRIAEVKAIVDTAKIEHSYNQVINFSDVSIEGLSEAIDPAKWDLTYSRLSHVYVAIIDIISNIHSNYLVKIPDSLRVYYNNSWSDLTRNTVGVTDAWWASKTNGEYHIPVAVGTNKNSLRYAGGVGTFIEANKNQAGFINALTPEGKMNSTVIKNISNFNSTDLTNITGTIFNIGKKTYATSKVSVGNNIFIAADIEIVNRINTGPYSKICKRWDSWALINIGGVIKEMVPFEGLSTTVRDIQDIYEAKLNKEIHYLSVNKRFDTLYLGLKSIDIRYGPWSTVVIRDAPIEIIVNDEFVPWNFGDDAILDNAVTKYVQSIKKTLNVIKRGQIACYDYYRAIIRPGYPIANGTDTVLTHINSIFGMNGWRTTLTFESYSKLPGTWRQTDYDQARKNKLSIDTIHFNLSEKLQGVSRITQMVKPVNITQRDKFSVFLDISEGKMDSKITIDA